MASSSPGGRGTPGRPNAHQLQLADTSSGLEQELEDILTLSNLGLADGLYTGWEFYKNTLSDRSGTYTFTHTRADTSGASYVGSDGYLVEVAAHVARYEWPAGGGACLGLLHEDGQTNLHVYSESMSSVWDTSNVTISQDSTNTSMTGSNSLKVVDDLTGNTCYARDASGTARAASTEYCLSIYHKQGNSDDMMVWTNRGDGSGAYVLWDISGATPSVAGSSNINSSGYETQVGGWIRYWFTFTGQGTSAGRTQIYNHFSGASVAGDYSYWCCSQLEVVPHTASRPTSWIPTTSSSETRAVDLAKIEPLTAGLSDIFTDPFSMYVQAQNLDDNGAVIETFFVVGLNTGATQNYIAIDNASSNTFRAVADTGAEFKNMTISFGADIAGMHKHAMVAAQDADGGCIYYIDGTKTTTAAGLGVLDKTGWDRFRIGSWVNDGLVSYRLILRELRIYSEAKTAAELASLTS